jgi:DNA-binding SARP family transcriptional activator
MSVLSVRLLGKLDVRYDGQTVIDLQSSKAQELFAYLLLHRGRSHTREALATTIWGENDVAQALRPNPTPSSRPGQARKYLRHTLWQLQKALDAGDPAHRQSSVPDGGGGVLLTDPDWIQLNPRAEVWLDVAEFERACTLARETPSQYLDRSQIQRVRQALDLYRGDLLEGWYQDWCLFERERLQQLYLALLDKHMIYCEAHGEYELGLACGLRALQCDVAHERTHRRMMRLRYLAGDRTGALRQYQRCVAFLRQELEVEPSARTIGLCERIRADRPLRATGATPDDALRTPATRLLPPPEALSQLQQLQTAFLELQGRLQETIETFQGAVTRQD